MKRILYLAITCMAIMFVSCGPNNGPEGGNGDNKGNKKQHLFSINPDFKQVSFSEGNLQYNPSKKTWRFAENPWDYIGAANANISENYDGWIDLFAWSGDQTLYPYGVGTSNKFKDYTGKFVDWGTNKIGKDQPGTWRTLSHPEWDFLLKGRPFASELRAIGQVCGVNGLILLPDSTVVPSDLSFRHDFNPNGGNAVEDYINYQVIDASEWKQLKNLGAIFLPAAGARQKNTEDAKEQMTDVVGQERVGYYWASTIQSGGDVAYAFNFDADYARFPEMYLMYGFSVRLVKDVE